MKINKITTIIFLTLIILITIPTTNAQNEKDFYIIGISHAGIINKISIENDTLINTTDIGVLSYHGFINDEHLFFTSNSNNEILKYDTNLNHIKTKTGYKTGILTTNYLIAQNSTNNQLEQLYHNLTPTGIKTNLNLTRIGESFTKDKDNIYVTQNRIIFKIEKDTLEFKGSIDMDEHHSYSSGIGGMTIDGNNNLITTGARNTHVINTSNMEIIQIITAGTNLNSDSVLYDSKRNNILSFGILSDNRGYNLFNGTDYTFIKYVDLKNNDFPSFSTSLNKPFIIDDTLYAKAETLFKTDLETDTRTETLPYDYRRIHIIQQSEPITEEPAENDLPSLTMPIFIIINLMVFSFVIFKTKELIIDQTPNIKELIPYAIGTLIYIIIIISLLPNMIL